LCSVFFIVCVVLCAVFCLIVVLFCVMCFICVLCLIVVSLPSGKTLFAVNNNNNNNNNNNAFEIYSLWFIYLTDLDLYLLIKLTERNVLMIRSHC
jgi:hypothetical protein